MHCTNILTFPPENNWAACFSDKGGGQSSNTQTPQAFQKQPIPYVYRQFSSIIYRIKTKNQSLKQIHHRTTTPRCFQQHHRQVRFHCHTHFHIPLKHHQHPSISKASGENYYSPSGSYSSNSSRMIFSRICS
ncbi:hypothetical protein BJ508DRAFT_154814 [Ascobolus immersus RN42]|uniref:Uncharacterized protein n=1 Tax=Ascobolus immersus RN42 TaxID=1160509 RepID=A0A3N4I3F6_ASCIM|nr:hypothetical protein BJ508DRAFT_154814 [Ascobolus immersus RN42]